MNDNINMDSTGSMNARSQLHVARKVESITLRTEKIITDNSNRFNIN